jgi:hypothetical protein
MAAEPRRWNQPDTGSHRLPIRTLCWFANINAGLPRRMGGIDYAGLTEPPGIPASQRIFPFMRPAGLAKRLYPGGARGSGSAMRMPVGLIKVIPIIRWRGFFRGVVPAEPALSSENESRAFVELCAIPHAPPGKYRLGFRYESLLASWLAQRLVCTRLPVRRPNPECARQRDHQRDRCLRDD